MEGWRAPMPSRGEAAMHIEALEFVHFSFANNLPSIFIEGNLGAFGFQLLFASVYKVRKDPA
jgi:hypothetical protein